MPTTDPSAAARRARTDRRRARPLVFAVTCLFAIVAMAAPGLAQTPATEDPPTTVAPEITAGPGPDPTTTVPVDGATTAPAEAGPVPPPTTVAGTATASTILPEATTTTTSAPQASTTPTTAALGRAAAAAIPEEPPEGFTQEQWRRVRNVVAACGNQPGAVCDRVLDWTGNRVLAESSQWLFDVPLRIVLILAVAVALNHFVRRAIASHLQRLAARSRQTVLADPSDFHRGARRMTTASQTLGSTATVLIYGIAVLVSLSELGIDLGPMLAGAGIAGIAIGFGAQNLVRDVLAGLFVILEDQYGVGDTIDVGKASGTVEEFTLRVTKLRDVEGTLWFVPNGTISEVGNKTQMWARAIIDIEVAYGADHRRAGELIKETADRLWREQRAGERIIEEPELWGVERLAESGVVIRLAVKSAPAEQWKVARTLRSEIKEALDAEGFEIPFPQRTVWVRSEDGRTGGPGLGQPEGLRPDQPR